MEPVVCLFGVDPFAAKFENTNDDFATSGGPKAALIVQTKKNANADFNLIYAQVNGDSGTEKFRVDGLGSVIVSSDAEAGTSAEGSIRTEGGLGVKKKAHIGDELSVDSEAEADSSTAGSIKTLGGLGVKKKAHIGTGLTVDAGGAAER